MGNPAKFASRFNWRETVSALVYALLLVLATGTSSAAEQFEKATLDILSAGKRHTFIVEIADTPRRREQGLMHRKSLPLNTGMVFVFEEQFMQHMWMKNTYVALDMLFADDSGKIVSIARRTEPLSLKVISSRVPARYVLELRAGTVDRLNIIVGDRMILPSH